jgi:hypothetical protein
MPITIVNATAIVIVTAQRRCAFHAEPAAHTLDAGIGRCDILVTGIPLTTIRDAFRNIIFRKGFFSHLINLP